MDNKSRYFPQSLLQEEVMWMDTEVPPKNNLKIKSSLVIGGSWP